MVCPVIDSDSLYWLTATINQETIFSLARNPTITRHLNGDLLEKYVLSWIDVERNNKPQAHCVTSFTIHHHISTLIARDERTSITYLFQKVVKAA